MPRRGGGMRISAQHTAIGRYARMEVVAPRYGEFRPKRVSRHSFRLVQQHWLSHTSTKPPRHRPPRRPPSGRRNTAAASSSPPVMLSRRATAANVAHANVIFFSAFRAAPNMEDTRIRHAYYCEYFKIRERDDAPPRPIRCFGLRAR